MAKMMKFTRGDWDCFAGAETITTRDDKEFKPLIGYVKAEEWPLGDPDFFEIEEDLNVKPEVTVIVDAQGLSINGANACFIRGRGGYVESPEAQLKLYKAALKMARKLKVFNRKVAKQLKLSPVNFFGRGKLKWAAPRAYFVWDQAGHEIAGPFETKAEAEKKAKQYGKRDNDKYKVYPR